MALPRDPSASSNGSPVRRGRAFTLVEIMVAVAVVSVLCTMALPAFKRIQIRAKSTVVVNDLRVFSQAFDQYAAETGSWPPDTAAGQMPPLMAGRLNSVQWLRITPIGGKYNWEYNQTHFGTKYKAAISIAAAAGAPLPLDVEQLTDIDRTMDDGNLLNGNLRIGTGLVPLWIIAP
jgi:prepilin-type N-terminal cleavage/methylation domain-containing protein